MFCKLEQLIHPLNQKYIKKYDDLITEYLLAKINAAILFLLIFFKYNTIDIEMRSGMYNPIMRIQRKHSKNIFQSINKKMTANNNALKFNFFKNEILT
ncbi:hypothetical protein BpHYR1_002176 [Brachionus plicatilis]|uniref:Uncharacterized protein n=1 Tax=Brachionus plicatilis TaxID=10195 RepID=A0A3M7Q972_BRAPC|nr:hypothetical protein BpHYR1_002176 [Brachionus plicatilis]